MPRSTTDHDHEHHDHEHHDHEHHDHEHHDPHVDRQHGRVRLGYGLAVLLGFALLVTLAVRSVFFVDETQYVYVTQFGQPIRLYTRAGLGLKWPFQSLWRFDRRLQLYSPPAREMLTEDKENLNVGWYVCWRIPDRRHIERQYNRSEPPPDDWTHGQHEALVRRFLQSVGTVESAEDRLEERIQAAIAAEVGHTRLDDLVSLDTDRMRLESIAEQVTQEIAVTAFAELGIEIVDVRIKRFNYPEAVKPAVYAEIRSERESVAVRYRAEGESQKTKIESLATLQRDQLLAQAERDAKRIQGDAEAKAMNTLNAAHRKNPDFYQLLKTLETYGRILDKETTVVLSGDSPLLKLLTRGLPELDDPLPSPDQSEAGREVAPIPSGPDAAIQATSGAGS